MESPSILLSLIQSLFLAGGVFCFYLIYRFAVGIGFSPAQKIGISLFLLLFGCVFSMIGGGFIYSDWIREDSPVPNQAFADSLFVYLDKNDDAVLDRKAEYEYKSGKYSRYWGSSLEYADKDGDSLVTMQELRLYVADSLDKDHDGFLRKKAAGWKRFMGKAEPAEFTEH